MRLPPRPTVYEINTAVWLRRLGCRLADVPAHEWDALAALPVDAVWLMGVWKRSPAGLEIALAEPSLGLAPGDDVIGSPYCVSDYVVDERFGGPDGLTAARAQLAARGLALILDYVPNHVAPDHPWAASRPDCLLTATEGELAADPAAFLRTGAGVVARGRDPYFPPWPDVVQLNAFSPALRDAAADTLIAIGGQSDGVRCDMAMRFIENHDEPRAAATFGPGQARAAAVAMSTLQGARLYHDGQFDGLRAHIPVFVDRGPDEPRDEDLHAFYERLLRAVADSGLRDGRWQLCDCTGWPDNDSNRNLAAWCWATADARHLVVVNLSPPPPRRRSGSRGTTSRAAIGR